MSTDYDRKQQELRREAQAETEKAEALEKARKKAQDDLHARTINEQIRKLETQLSIKRRALELVVRDIQAADERARKTARTIYTAKSSSNHDLESEEREVRDITRKLETVRATERTLEDELSRHTRELEYEKKKVEKTTSELKNTERDGEQAMRDKKGAEHKKEEAEREITAIEREIETLKRTLPPR